MRQLYIAALALVACAPRNGTYVEGDVRSEQRPPGTTAEPLPGAMPRIPLPPSGEWWHGEDFARFDSQDTSQTRAEWLDHWRLVRWHQLRSEYQRDPRIMEVRPCSEPY